MTSSAIDLNQQRKFIPLSGVPSGGIQVTPECQVEPETGGNDLQSTVSECEKINGHANFIPPSEFSIDHIPPDHRREKTLDYIKYWADLTVRVIARYTSLQRPDTFEDSDIPYPYVKFRGSRRKPRYGTGTITSIWDESNTWEDFDNVPPEVECLVDECPCQLCKDSVNPEKEFWTIKVETAAHVIFDDSEAERATFECFYDSEDDKGTTVKTFYGFKILDKTFTREERYCSDFVEVACITHDKELADRLNYHVIENYPRRTVRINKSSNLSVMISHPHGLSKKITVGRIVDITVPLGTKHNSHDQVNVLTYLSDWTVCRLQLYPWSKVLSDENQTMIEDTENVKSGNVVMDPHLSFQDEEGACWLRQINTAIEEFELPPRPGTKFLLPRGISFILPKNAQYARKYYNLDSPWFMFPPGTKIYLRNGLEINLPPETEFACHVMRNKVGYVNYDTDTCPGSSGGGVLQDNGYRVVALYNHYGSSPSINRSGINVFTGFEISKPLPFSRRQECLKDLLQRLNEIDLRGEASAY